MHETPHPGAAGGASLARAARALSASARRHPIITALLVSCTALGAVLGAAVLGDDWSLARRVAGGALGGMGVGLLIATPRMLG